MTKKKPNPTRKMFRDPSCQVDMFEKSYEEELEARKTEAVRCLGIEFENDDARREHFLGILHEGLLEVSKKLGGVPFTSIEDTIARLDSLEKWPMGNSTQLLDLARSIQESNRQEPEKKLLQLWKDQVGFPHGDIEDILSLSDPPYFTVCPNPFISEYIISLKKDNERDESYARTPFARDVKANKRHPIYIAHSYHTKVPHEAIVRYILHYTEPGDIVLDGLSGSGMTGVASLFCMKPEEKLRVEVDKEWEISYKRKPNWGFRPTVLIDLSPFASFLGRNNTTHRPAGLIRFEAERIAQKLDDVCSWMYIVQDSDGVKRIANYYVWSDVFTCPECAGDLLFWKECVEKGTGDILDTFICPHCQVGLTKRELELNQTTAYDQILGISVSMSVRRPVLVNVIDGKSKTTREINPKDNSLIEKIQEQKLSEWVPNYRMPEGDESRRNDKFGVTHVHHFFTKRNLIALSTLFGRINKAPTFTRNALQFMATSLFRVITIRSLFLPKAYFQGGTGPFKPHSSGTLYIPSLTGERNIVIAWKNRIEQFVKFFEMIPKSEHAPIISTQSSTNLWQIPDEAIDYIFVDPPFGKNIMYSELNFIWEAWLRVTTNNANEAVQNQTQNKDLINYQHLMTACFSEFHRVLRPGRWITVIFHNSSNIVWNAIQTAIQESGLIIADIRTLDRKQGTYVQYTTAGSVKDDLVISAYRPSKSLEKSYKLSAGTEAGAWDFIRSHLNQLPVFVSRDDCVEVITERQNYLLYDRMVAFHVQRGVTVPFSAAEFYCGLSQRFPERDGMYFLPDQAAEYDKRRLNVKEIFQLQLFITDEESSIQWLKQQLTQKPQSFQEIHPQFLKEIGGWQKHEKPLELSDLLEQNFIRFDGMGEVPSQIHSYLSTNYKDLRNREKDDPALQSKAKDRWYVPDPNKQADLEKLREKTLLREFAEYRESKQRRLKVFRLEAVRAGFKKAWQDRDYTSIIEVAEKIPENVLQEDPKLLMWYDQAITRSTG